MDVLQSKISCFLPVIWVKTLCAHHNITLNGKYDDILLLLASDRHGSRTLWIGVDKQLGQESLVDESDHCQDGRFTMYKTQGYQ